MKKTTLIILAGTILAVSCSKKSNTTSTTSTGGDSTFNGSYLQLTIGSKNFYEKDVNVKNVGHIVSLTAGNTSITLLSGGTTSGLVINLLDQFGTYGLISADMYATGSGTGTYSFTNTAGTNVNQSSPSITYLDSTGTMNITHNGTDYIQGTIGTTFYHGTDTYPVTGSFKIYQ
jgi:ATP-dependent Zn protease